MKLWQSAHIDSTCFDDSLVCIRSAEDTDKQYTVKKKKHPDIYLKKNAPSQNQTYTSAVPTVVHSDISTILSGTWKNKYTNENQYIFE